MSWMKLIAGLVGSDRLALVNSLKINPLDPIGKKGLILRGPSIRFVIRTVYHC